MLRGFATTSAVFGLFVLRPGLGSPWCLGTLALGSCFLALWFLGFVFPPLAVEFFYLFN